MLQTSLRKWVWVPLLVEATGDIVEVCAWCIRSAYWQAESSHCCTQFKGRWASPWYLGGGYCMCMHTWGLLLILILTAIFVNPKIRYLIALPFVSTLADISLIKHSSLQMVYCTLSYRSSFEHAQYSCFLQFLVQQILLIFGTLSGITNFYTERFGRCEVHSITKPSEVVTAQILQNNKKQSV